MKPDIAAANVVRQAAQDTIRYLAHGAAISVESWMEEESADLVESPIEAVFGIWWMALKSARRLFDWTDLRLTPQPETTIDGRTYRLDFRVDVEDPDVYFVEHNHSLGIGGPLIAVELDGHDFHERTREQIAYRNQRDADLQVAGWKVFHFSGSQVFRDPLACVQRVYDFAEGQFSAFRGAVRAEIRRRGITE